MTASCSMRFLIITNPAAGRRGAARLADDVHGLLQRSGADSSVALTTEAGDAESIALRALEGISSAPAERLCVVACGGDGTIQEVVNALLRRPQAGGVLGVAPGGRCNDFASAFGIVRDARRIAEVLLARRVQPVDVGRVNDRYFCTIASVGFDATVARYVNGMRVPLSGTTAYVYGVMRVLATYQSAATRLTFEDSVLDGPLFLAACANTPSYGGRMRIAPQASAYDGMLDLCVVSKITRLRVLRLLPRVLGGRHTDMPEVRMLRMPSVRIDSSVSQEIWADGEMVGKTPATIEIVPGALDMLVPEPTP